MKLSRHFTIAEFTRSETALTMRIPNTPGTEHLCHLKATALGMEQVRRTLNNLPITITSGYRSPALNEAVGGVPDSDHALGWAADFVCPVFGTPFDICTAIDEAGIAFDQLIHERRRWVHISFNPRLRRQLLTLPPQGGKYVPGLVP